MTEALVLYALTAAIFLGVDAVALRVLIKPIFDDALGDWLYDSPRLVPAGVFYLFYALALVILVSWPAYTAGTVVQALWQGALIGAMAYGTYEFTNLSTLRRWTARQVAVDGTWGTVLTALSAAGGVWLTGLIFG
ncbi:DUF2177 family protein [Rhodobacterales bacterium HKCCE4037]|nr:DUF2177 family protein [Rhodobacterales bacterium HKCCE4037]